MNEILDFEYTPEVATFLLVMFCILFVLGMAWLDKWEEKKIDEMNKETDEQGAENE